MHDKFDGWNWRQNMILKLNISKEKKIEWLIHSTKEYMLWMLQQLVAMKLI